MKYRIQLSGCIMEIVNGVWVTLKSPRFGHFCAQKIKNLHFPEFFFCVKSKLMGVHRDHMGPLV